MTTAEAFRPPNASTRGTLAAIGALALIVLSPGTAFAARGVSPYLPYGIAPEIERRIERLLILADEAILTRPIAAATVLDALDTACPKDPLLCEEVRRYLGGYMQSYGIGYAGLEVAVADDASIALPNRHGMRSDSAYELAAQIYWQASDYLLLQGGVLANETDSAPTGSMISVGNEYVQVDLGFRDRWLSPMTDSSMLVSTEAQTMPSITVSNYTPLTRWGFRYQVFFAEMSESDNIAFGDGTISGSPRLAGMHLSIEPVPGWSIGVNRIMQYGGGNRPDSFSDLFDAFFDPSQFDNAAPGLDRDEEFGNQVASVTSRYLHPGDTPFAVYLEYAGEDTSKTSNLRLGNASLSAGIQFPSLWRGLEVTVEASEWQNGWYTHGIYGDGLVNEGNVIGHWGGDQRQPRDGVGARSLMARVGYTLGSGAHLEATLRVLDNEPYTAPDYERAYFGGLRYSRRWSELFVGGALDAGRDSFGRSYARLAGFIRY